MTKTIVNAKLAPAAVGPYAHAVIANGFIYTSGQIGLIPGSKNLAAGIEEQTIQALENLSTVLESANSSMDKVIKTTIFMADMNDYATINEIYSRYFWRNPPARSAVQVARLPLGALVEIEVVALV